MSPFYQLKIRYKAIDIYLARIKVIKNFEY